MVPFFICVLLKRRLSSNASNHTTNQLRPLNRWITYRRTLPRVTRQGKRCTLPKCKRFSTSKLLVEIGNERMQCAYAWVMEVPGSDVWVFFFSLAEYLSFRCSDCVAFFEKRIVSTRPLSNKIKHSCKVSFKMCFHSSLFRYQCSPGKSLYFPLAQLPVFASFFFGLKTMGDYYPAIKEVWLEFVYGSYKLIPISFYLSLFFI